MYISREVIFKNFEPEDAGQFFCKMCEFPLVSYDDFRISSEWNGCCQECYLTFIEARKVSWKEGWRPDKETLEEYIYKRKQQLQEKK